MRLGNLDFRGYHSGGAIAALLRVVAAAPILLKVRLRLKKYKELSTFHRSSLGKSKHSSKRICVPPKETHGTYVEKVTHALRNFSPPSVALIYLLLLLPPFQDVSCLVIVPLALLLWGLFRGGRRRCRHLLRVHGRRRRRLVPRVLQHGLSEATPVPLYSAIPYTVEEEDKEKAHDWSFLPLFSPLFLYCHAQGWIS